jgi:AraC family transcriptional regulator of adaptative response / DNA-3-methyladenine glycosylase II
MGGRATYRQGMTPAHTAWSRARRARDARFDGRFFVAVTTTGIYCRPVCPAPSPLERHVRYFESAAAAAEAGFRPCLRCRPEVAPGSPAWQGTPATVQRALRLIEAGVPDGIRVRDLATSLGMGPRHLHRLFLQHLGASPLAVIQTRRLHFAKQLVDGTTLPLAEIAMAAGFGSIRRFNAAVRQTWNRTPSSLRREHGGRRDAPFEVVLAYRPPYDWEGLLDFLAFRAVPGLEQVERGRYRRSVDVGGDAGWIEVSHDRARHGVRVSAHVDSPRALYRVVAGVRRMFDLDADPEAIASQLAPDPMLGPLVARAPGRRVPGSWDGFELAVRAVIGQQCSVAAARTLVARIVHEYGTPITAAPPLVHLFPAPGVLADAPIERLGVLPRRAAAVRALARAVASGQLSLTRESEAAEARAALMDVPGIGAWTTEYVAMRALGDPDAFPLGDLALARAAGLDGRTLARRADGWRPWRAYAALHLWMGASHEDRDTRARGRREPRRAAAARRGGRGALRRAIPRSA